MNGEESIARVFGYSIQQEGNKWVVREWHEAQTGKRMTRVSLTTWDTEAEAWDAHEQCMLDGLDFSYSPWVVWTGKPAWPELPERMSSP